MLLLTYLAWMILGEINASSNFNKYILDTSLTDKLCDNSLVSFEAASRSSIECTYLCESTPGCTGVVVHRTSQTCYGITDYFACIGQSSALQGAKFYKQASVVGCGNLMSVVADSQITASSEWSTAYLPHYGRLDDASHWSAGTTGTAEYLQIDFLTAKNITGFTTQGSCCSHGQWVGTYRFLYSIDCLTYTAIQDGGGQDKIFTGNTDDTSYVTHSLVTPILGRCVRLNPLTYTGWVTTRLGVIGCQ